MVDGILVDGTLVDGRLLIKLPHQRPGLVSDYWKTGIVFSDLTDVGMRRANNQDSHSVIPAENLERFHQRGHLFVVADGMGAHAAGELASRMATEAIAMHYFRNVDVSPPDALRSAVIDANEEIHRRGQQNPEFHNMGTTASALAVLPQGAFIAHVGDSRIYRLRDSTLEQMTFDHSLVWEMEASGQVHPESALGQSIPKNVITRSLGPNAEVVVDVEGPLALRKGDCFLLCSDGLSGLVDDPEIGTLISCLPEDLAARVLIDLANLRGGPDNSTVVIVRITEDLTAIESAPEPKPAPVKVPVSPLVVTTAGICFAGALLLGILQLWGPMVMAILLGIIAAGVCLYQYLTAAETVVDRPLPKISGGKAPYRSYSAKPSRGLYDRLGETVDALRAAASENNWLMDWTKIDQLQKRGDAEVKSGKAENAIRLQAEAIVETMHQLREQNNRAADETAIDY